MYVCTVIFYEIDWFKIENRYLIKDKKKYKEVYVITPPIIYVKGNFRDQEI